MKSFAWFSRLAAISLLVASPVSAQSATRHTTTRGLLRELNTSVEDLTARVSLSVVQVVATGYGAVDEHTRGETGLVRSVDGLRVLIDNVKANSDLVLQIERSGQLQFMACRIY